MRHWAIAERESEGRTRRSGPWRRKPPSTVCKGLPVAEYGSDFDKQALVREVFGLDKQNVITGCEVLQVKLELVVACGQRGGFGVDYSSRGVEHHYLSLVGGCALNLHIQPIGRRVGKYGNAVGKFPLTARLGLILLLFDGDLPGHRVGQLVNQRNLKRRLPLRGGGTQ